MRVVLTVAGSDSSGGAGIQADLKSIAANGGYGASAVTAVTAQNTRGVDAAAEIDPALIRAQIDAVCSDLPVAAVKSGMLASPAVIETVAAALRHWRPASYVLDPVMIAKSGFPLLPAECAPLLLEQLAPLATLITPNVHEAEQLTGLTVRTLADAEAAGRRLLESGAAAAVVKGGHLAEAPGTDVLVGADGVTHFTGEWLDSRNTHGTGCTYASAVATRLAQGMALPDAVAHAKSYVTEAIRRGPAIGGGARPLNHFPGLAAGAADGGQR